jgi:hypothetical protein
MGKLLEEGQAKLLLSYSFESIDCIGTKALKTRSNFNSALATVISTTHAS